MTGGGPYVIGCDVGSQGTNSALYAADGTLVASAYEAYDLSFPHPTWAEQDPTLWSAALERTVGKLVSEVSEGSSAVKGISFGSQLDGMVVCDANGRALRPAMIWMDRRAEAQSASVAERLAPQDFYRYVGANLDSSHAVFKALWVRDEEPEIWKDAAILMSPGTYALRAVSGVTAVDYSNASSLALLDPRTRAWSEPVLEATGIDPAMLPELGAGTQNVGTVTAAFAEATGLSPETVVAIGCGDEMAATLGAGVFAPGEVCDVVGTAEPVCAASAEPREDPTMLVECHPHADPDAWLLENPGFVSGGNLRWWRDTFAPLERQAEAAGEGDAYDLLSREAAEVPAGAEGLVFLPCMQGAMAPEWNGAGARHVLRTDPRARSRSHDEGDPGRERLRPARHPRGDGERRTRRAAPHDRRWRREGSAVAPDQGRCDGPARPRADQRRDDRDRRRDPRRRGIRRAYVCCGRGRRVRFVPTRGTSAGSRATRGVRGRVRRYRDVYFALKPVFERG